jgi:hypothetical protein
MLKFTRHKKVQSVFSMLCSNQSKKQIIAQFDGGEITSDGGLLLLREAALGMDLFHRMARCFWDRRDTPIRQKHHTTH